jgi:hypothetical protein
LVVQVEQVLLHLLLAHLSHTQAAEVVESSRQVNHSLDLSVVRVVAEQAETVTTPLETLQPLEP